MKVKKNALAKCAGAFFALLEKDETCREKKIKKIYKKVLTQW